MSNQTTILFDSVDTAKEVAYMLRVEHLLNFNAITFNENIANFFIEIKTAAALLNGQYCTEKASCEIDTRATARDFCRKLKVESNTTFKLIAFVYIWSPH